MKPSLSYKWLGSRLLRTTSTGRLIPELDGLRSVAILSVVVYHLNCYLAARLNFSVAAPEIKLSNCYRLFTVGEWGVQLFFVISGFILLLPFIEATQQGGARISIGKFYKRRFLRIMPPYVINLSILFAAMLVVKQGTWHSQVPHFLASLFYMHGFIFGCPSTISYVTWTLEIEIQFYLMAPLLGFLFLVNNVWLRRGLLVITSIVIPIGMNTVGLEIPVRIQNSIAGHLHYFLIGILVADCYCCYGNEKYKKFAFDGIGVAAWGLVIVFPQWIGHKGIVLHLLMMSAIFLACFCSLRGKLLSSFFAGRFLVVIGGMCYTIYLYHYPLISLLGRMLPTVKSVVWHDYSIAMFVNTLLFLPFVIGCAILFFLIFEKPFMAKEWLSKLRNSVSGMKWAQQIFN